MAKKLTQEEFIERAKKVHGDKYDYGKTVYTNNKQKITVTCPLHGDFKIRADGFLRGSGCQECGGTKKMTQEEFIEKANFVHNNFFTYEHCIFNGVDKKVIVTCPIHGDFEVKGNNHLSGVNCKQCKKEKINHKITKLPKRNVSTQKLTTKEFIEKAKEKWGDKYTYENVKYTKSNVDVMVTCPIHGDFPVTPNHFLNNRGCPKCGKNYTPTTEEFIDRLKEVNGDRYTYEKTIYKSTHEPVILTCPIHGDFINEPSNLLKGQGCPNCAESILEKEISELLKKNNILFERQKRFLWLGRQSLDFYLPDYNIAIECQGEQHFEPVEMFGGILQYEKQVENDKLKEINCKLNNVLILYCARKKKYIDNVKILDKINLLKRIKEYVNGKK